MMENKNIMVTSSGLVHNAGWQSINNEVGIDDLFHP